MLIGVIAEELLLAEAGSGWSAAPFIDVDSFPLATIAVPGFLLVEGQFDDGDVIYATFITAGQGIFPQLVVDTDVIYAATRQAIVPALAPPLVSATDLFYSPAVLTNVLAPSLVIDDDLYGGVKKLTQGKASINQHIPIDCVIDSDIIFRPLVEYAGTTLIPQQAALAAETELVYLNETTRSATPISGSSVNETAALTAPPLGYLSAALVASDDVIFAPDMRRPIVLAIFNDADVIYAASRFDRLVPGRVLDSEAVFPGSFGGPTVLPGIAVDADAFFAPAVSIVTGLAATLFSDGDIFFAPLVPPTLAAGLVTDSDTFHAPAENSIGGPAVFTDTDTFFAPTVTQTGFDGTLALDGPIMPSTPQPTVIFVEG